MVGFLSGLFSWAPLIGPSSLISPSSISISGMILMTSIIFHRVSQSLTFSSNFSFSPHFRRSRAITMAVSMSNGTGSGFVRFKISNSTACVIQKGDITQWFIDGSSDAIVNPANEVMLGGGGADGAIHNAAGPNLVQACYSVPEVQPGIRCPTGEARITPGFRLPSSHVIHTVGPIYNTSSNPQALLRSAYRNSLAVAKENNIQYIAFPAISCGVYRYPLDEAATIALSTVREFSEGLKEVHFVLYSSDIYKVWLDKGNELLKN